MNGSEAFVAGLVAESRGKIVRLANTTAGRELVGRWVGGGVRPGCRHADGQMLGHVSAPTVWCPRCCLDEDKVRGWVAFSACVCGRYLGDDRQVGIAAADADLAVLIGCCPSCAMSLMGDVG